MKEPLTLIHPTLAVHASQIRSIVYIPETVTIIRFPERVAVTMEDGSEFVVYGPETLVAEMFRAAEIGMEKWEARTTEFLRRMIQGADEPSGPPDSSDSDEDQCDCGHIRSDHNERDGCVYCLCGAFTQPPF